jgi:hypothetical protein
MTDMEVYVLMIGAPLVTAAFVCRLVLIDAEHIKEDFCRLFSPTTSKYVVPVAHTHDAHQVNGTEVIKFGNVSSSALPISTPGAARLKIRLRLCREGQPLDPTQRK